MIETKKLDSANSIISSKIENTKLEKKKDEIAKKIAKTAKIQGFRPGKVPVNLVKKMYASDIEQDAISSLIKEILDEGVKLLEITEMIAEPEVVKFDKNDNGIDVEIKVYTKPAIKLEAEYIECVPEVEEIEVTEEEINSELENIAKSMNDTKVSQKDTLEKGDIAIIDFTGYVDGKKIDNATATEYPLEIGSNSFIEGFEDQLIGMKIGETRKIKVKFPENYQSKELAGKEAEFEVTLHEIQEKVPAKIDDKLAKKYLNDENATLETLKNYLKDNIINRKKVDIYKPKKEEIVDCLIKKYEIDLPEAIVEKEVEAMINNKASKMTPAEIKELQENREKLEELKKELLPEAKDRVKLTFIIDAIAKKENVDISDEEITQIIYYEALMQGQNPQDVIKYYQENNLIPVLKMQLIEEKLLNKLLDEKASK